MRVAALVAWIVTAFVGFYVIIPWIAEGALRGQATKVTRFPVALVLGHPGVALVGLGCWIAFVVTAAEPYAWAALAAVTGSALLGFILLTRWLLGRGRHARGAEQTFPTVAVAVHGLAGVTAVVLVLLTVAQL